MLRVCYCCGVSKSTNNDEYEQIDRYINKPVIKTKTADGKKIIKEVVYISVCNNCNSLVVEIRRSILNRAGKASLEEKETIRGKEAENYYLASVKNRIYTPLESPYYKNSFNGKTIPFIYGKVLDGKTQVPRYSDESGNAGNIINMPIKKIFLNT